jgi:putative intracellular protease/amidase
MSDQKTVLIVLTSHGILGRTGKATGYYLPELSHALAEFRAAGLAVDFASPQGGKPPMDGVDRKDPKNAAVLDDSALMQRLGTTKKLSEVDIANYDAIYVPGGHGTVWDLPDDAHLQRIIATLWQRGGVVGAVCHGPAALVNVKLEDGRYLVDGQRVAAFTDDEERAAGLDGVVPFLLASTLKSRGARHEQVGLWQPLAVVGERLVTGQNPASTQKVASAMVALLTA